MTDGAPPSGRPWHLIIAPVIPILGLLRGNSDITQASAAAFPIAIAVAVALTLWAAGSVLTRDRLASALAVSVVMLGGMSYGSIARAADLSGIPALTPSACALILLIAFRMQRIGPRAAAFTSFANTALSIALVFLIAPIARSEWQRRVLVAAELPLQQSSTGRRPDVYVLILDGYGREDVLRSFGFENDLVKFLRQSGFYVADDARANYPQTVHSLASALNMRYLPELIGSVDSSLLTRRSLGDLIRTNAFMQAFSSAGYDVRFYRSEYDLVRPKDAAALRGPVAAVNEFDLAVYESTVLPQMSRLAGFTRGALPLVAHRRHVRWTFEDVLRSTSDGGSNPRLTFAHVLAPHPPFAFNPDGSDRETALPALMIDGDQWRAMAHGSGEQYDEGYLATLGYVNARVRQVVQAILARSDRHTIIYIQGDHGPGSRLRFDDPANSDLLERFGILLALRLPDGGQEALPHAVTPVNAFRVIANAALGTNLLAIEDRSYFASWTRPFEFTDVTSHLVGCNAEDCDSAGRQR